jgi:hypothetical protein
MQTELARVPAEVGDQAPPVDLVDCVDREARDEPAAADDRAG